MALATRCPACSTVFRISTAQAAAKGGMVRCGQCRNVFNSLDALVRVEDLEVIDEVVVEAAAPMAEVASTTAVGHGGASVAAAAVEAPVNAPANAVADDAVVQEAVVERPAIGEWWLPEPGTRRAPIADTAEADPEPSSGLRDDAGQILSGRRTDLQWSGIGSVAADPSFLRPEAAPIRSTRTARWIFGALTLVAAVVLLGQVAYQWRDELAVRWSPARPWLVAACVPLRCKVDYPAHLDAITIESASIQTAGANLNIYVLVALLRNRDAFDVRYPHLQLVLTDLQDRPILRRALRPEDYLAPRPALGGFPAESELPIRVMFELSDIRFAGYRLERFYP